MSSTTWLEKEEEYRKLNDELQMRNKMLMKEFDTVVKKQDNLLKEPIIPSIFEKKSYSFVQNQVKTFDYNSKENYGVLPNENIEVVGIPSSVDQMGVKGMSTFYRSKIKSILNENDKLQVELKNKSEEFKKLQKDYAKSVDDKEKWFQAYNANRATITKLENQITSLNAKFQSKESEVTALRKDMDLIKKDFKVTSLTISSSEVRLNRALEENEKIKSVLKIAKQEEKQLKEAHNKEVNDLTSTLKQQEKQKNEVLTAFKKQMQLVDNLKQQKTFLEALKIAEMSENEFMKILNWKFD